MAITSLTGNQPIQPTKAYSAYLAGVNATSYTTILNVTSGKGMVSKIIVSSATSGTYASNTVNTIRITVDGGSALTLANGGNSYLRGYEHNAGNATTTVPQSLYTFEYAQPFYFTKSVLIEVVSTATTTYAVVDYALV